jgi:colicin import membrane protein
VTPNKASNPGTESASEFAERMAKLERAAEARQQEAALARLQEKVRNQGSGRAGMPGGTGKEAGSDYLAYIQSRLKDAFQMTITHTSQKPEMTVRLFIDSDGKLARKKAERSSGDRAFEISVFRAIDAASEKFPPPPGRKVFEGVFVFRREGISPNRP